MPLDRVKLVIIQVPSLATAEYEFPPTVTETVLPASADPVMSGVTSLVTKFCIVGETGSVVSIIKDPEEV